LYDLHAPDAIRKKASEFVAPREAPLFVPFCESAEISCLFWAKLLL
jgi:hypothetical protein